MAAGGKPRAITVCSACLTGACWQGVLVCEDARQAGITQTPLEDAELLAALRGMAEAGVVLARHLQTITDALHAVLAGTPYNALKVRYLAVLRDLEPLAEGIAKYGGPVHTEPSGVRYVRSSDSAASGDEISG